ncbi:MAG: hypothetical protein LBT66_07880 [Methanobrevibacter sp.]|nr:hypothetical protein [Candidatus Methanovirga meridionalis]
MVAKPTNENNYNNKNGLFNTIHPKLNTPKPKYQKNPQIIIKPNHKQL